jgi:hypothetical protein
LHFFTPKSPATTEDNRKERKDRREGTGFFWFLDESRGKSAKIQAPKRNARLLELGAWSFSGAWMLELGALAVLCALCALCALCG